MKPGFKISEKTERRIFVASAAISVFALGVFSGLYNPIIKGAAGKAQSKVEDLKRNGLAYLGIKPSGHLAPYRNEIISAVKVDTTLAEPGVTLLTGLFGDKLAARLVSVNGDIIHEWPNNLFDLFGDTKRYKFGALVHGDYLYPNGDLLVVIDHVGIARISACGKVLWKTPSHSHHSIDVDDDGFIWTPIDGKTHLDKRLALTPARFDRIAKFDPVTGKRVEVIDIDDMLIETGSEGIIQGNGIDPSDALHLNDVEILKKSMAPAFPQFAAGDILASIRNVNQLWVIDGKTHRIKWRRVGPMNGQHDPDFEPDGEIVVFDNRASGAPTKKNGFMGEAGEGSRIIAFKPDRFGYRTLYQSGAGNKFYSQYRGKLQLLKNGNLLITESEAGRAFEATPDGRIAFEYVSRYDENEVGWLTSATRYPQSYAAIGANCPAPAADNK